MALNLNLLAVLDALLQERSVSKAAIRLGRSQPAVSHALQQLRGIFGDELLVRVGQHYELTAAAVTLADPLHLALQQLGDIIVARPMFDPVSAEREFRIAAPDYIVAILLRPVIQSVARVAPRIRFTILPPAEDPFGQLRDGRLHMSFDPLERRSTASDTCCDVVLRDSWCCAAWSGNPLIGDELTRETYDLLRHVMGPIAPLPDAHARQLGTERSANDQLVSTNFVMVMPFLVEETNAVAVLPRRLADWACQAAALRVLPLPFDLPEMLLGMYWNARSTADPGHLWLRSLVKHTASGLPELRRS